MVLLSWATRRSARASTWRGVSSARSSAAAGVLIILSSASPALHARSSCSSARPAAAGRGGADWRRRWPGCCCWRSRAASRADTAPRSNGDDGAAAARRVRHAAEGARLGGERAARHDRRLPPGRRPALFDRDSGGDWLEWADLGLGFAALLLFVIFGMFSHHIGAAASRALVTRSAIASRPRASCAAPRRWLLAVQRRRHSTCCCGRRSSSSRRRKRTSGARSLHAAYGTGTTPMMVAVGRQVRVFRRRRAASVCTARSVRISRCFRIRSCAVAAERGGVPRRAVRVRRRDRSAAAVLPDLARTGFRCCTTAAITSSSWARKRTCRSIASRSRARRQDDPADPPPRRARRGGVPRCMQPPEVDARIGGAGGRSRLTGCERSR